MKRLDAWEKIGLYLYSFFRESSSERYGGQNMVMGKLQDESRLENDHISVWICDTEDECSLNQ